jgi:hypothetical protein
MTEHMEDEEKIGSNEDLAHAKEENMPKKPSNSDLIKAYLEDKEDEENEEKENS